MTHCRPGDFSRGRMTLQMNDDKPLRPGLFASFILHLHPRTVPAETLRFSLSLGLGGMAALLSAPLIGTGILQLLSYSPRIDEAYLSIQKMYDRGNPAGFIRNIHYWSGNLLVIVAFLHLLRVFLTGALDGVRSFNWILGTLLFVLVLLANFTGYLMPWDQLAYWAVTIFTSMVSYVPFVGEHLMNLLRGGLEVGPATLANFFALHAGIIPIIMLLLMIWHFWLIRKAGGLVRRSEPDPALVERLPTVPYLIRRETAVGLGLMALLFLFCALVDAPLGEMANPGQSPNPAKAAWYFLGLQELLMHLHPVFAVCVVPLLILISFISLPFLKDAVLPQGHWFGGKGGARTALWTSAAGAAVIAVGVIADNHFSSSAPAAAAWLREGAVLAVYGGMLAGLFLLLRKKFSCSRAESVMGLFMFVAGGVLALTAVGIWFRGPEMALVLPF